MKVAVTFCLIGVSLMVSAQENYFVSVGSSWNTYSMSQLKDLQAAFVLNAPVSLHPLASFPSYLGYNATFGKNFSEKKSVAVFISYYSTGARADYEDYSGIARIDQLAYDIGYGFILKSQFNKSTKWPLSFSLQISRHSTHVDISDLLSVSGQSQSDIIPVKSTNYAFRPGLSLQHSIFKNIYLEANAGYEFQIPGKLYSVSNSNAYLINQQSGQAVTADWSGTRFGLSIGMFLGKENE